MKLTIYEEVDVRCDPEDECHVEAIFGARPILVRAAAVATWGKRQVNGRGVIEADAIILALNSLYPESSFDVGTLADFLTGKAHFTLEEFEILKGVLPERGSYRYRLQSGTHLVLTVERTPKDGCYSEIRFRGNDNSLSLPMTVEVDRYTDMDDNDNHGDECDGHNCECEASLDHQSEIVIADWDEAARQRLVEFIYENCVV